MADDRRNFLAKLLSIGTLALAPKVEVKRIVEDHMRYMGYDLVWSGWKKMPDQDTEVGQWCGLKKNENGEIQGWGYYASYPGAEGRYYPGQMFNVCIMPDQLPVNFITSEEDREQGKMDALQRVMRQIDTNGASKVEWERRWNSHA